MAEQFFTSPLLYFVETMVLMILAFFLFMFYRGFGRTYVKLWVIALGWLVVNRLVLLLMIFLDITKATDPILIGLTFLNKLSFNLSTLMLFWAIYKAVSGSDIIPRRLWGTIFLVTLFTFFSVILFAFDDYATFNRLYLRESLNAFIVGCGFLASSFWLFNQPKSFFASRIFMWLFLALGFRFVSYSLASVMLLGTDYFGDIVRAILVFDSGAYAVLGYAMLIWMQGAERNIAITAINRAQYLGKHDQLTGALNREQVLEKLPFAMEKSQQSGARLAIYLIDIKRFKFINDTYGLSAGDYILAQVAIRLSQSVLLPDVVGRLSGDSFVFAIEIHELSQLSKAADHIHDIISAPYEYQEHNIELKASVGYSLYPDHGDDEEDLLKKANLALFHAETESIASVQYIEGMQAKGRELMAIEKELNHAFENNEFILYFQPQLNLYSNKLEGVEALVRWQHPEKGLLAPGQFLDKIEQLSMNRELDHYVLELSAQKIQHWLKEFKRRVTIAVNVTSVEFQDPQFVGYIQSLLYQYQIPPSSIELEITENVVINDIESVMDTIIKLQNLGIRVSIDDFGTGYSSLAYLRKLPIDKIKIDRSFIQEVANNDSDVTIVKSMIKLSHGLGKRVLAEGVEDANQLQLLRKLGCDAVQGYYIAKPLPEEELTKFLSRRD
ncbi:EAL domain-containing protein [Thalassotalea sp. LPB0316]|uniref:putative bifunctional diguanylate cyclase/phosphodiesterase n=1 Tax=Thalassotalea sp. LPB0316 TaxID=2769490 RepID=UPI0018690173|nr:GGDEF domain-containing phosphodiesterase [Thalassotalea sp. LPB0316]QOL25998.1 EAL domain-containing protein [Thalassotalea sp. LPB0316]